MLLIDITGMKCGRWTVIRRAATRVSGVFHDRHVAMWLCRCVCGVEREVESRNLREGHSLSCGCYRADASRDSIERKLKSRYKHSLSKSAEYGIWCNMKQRCNNPLNTRYKDYGGRGVQVCQEWRNSFEAFYAAMGPRPSKAHTVDRIDNDGNYEPGNCRWATKVEQSENQRCSILITIDGKTMGLARWASELGLSKSTVRHRIKHGWAAIDAVTTPAQLKNAQFIESVNCDDVDIARIMKVPQHRIGQLARSTKNGARA